MSISRIGVLAPVVMGIFALAAAPMAHADYVVSGNGTSGHLDGSSEAWAFNADGGKASTGYLDNWGSPGVGAGTTDYSQTHQAFGMSLTFSGAIINADSIAIGNGKACAGSTRGGSTFCTIGSPDDIWQAFLTAPDTIEFRAQNASFFLSQAQKYFVNIFFDGAAPSSFTGRWLTDFSPDPGTGPVSVPEPGSIGMLGGGLLGLGLILMLRRRRYS